MRTRTIYAAQSEAALACERDALSHRDGKPYQFTERRKRKERQWTVFERELLRRMDERDLLLEMHGKPTPIYDKLKAEGLNPPVSVMLIDSRKLTAEEVAYGLSLMEAE